MFFLFTAVFFRTYIHFTDGTFLLDILIQLWDQERNHLKIKINKSLDFFRLYKPLYRHQYYGRMIQHFLFYHPCYLNENLNKANHKSSTFPYNFIIYSIKAKKRKWKANRIKEKWCCHNSSKPTTDTGAIFTRKKKAMREIQ